MFQQSLGWQHPRTQAACRNLRHVQHKCNKLEMKYNIRDRPRDASSSKEDGVAAASTGRRQPEGQRMASPIRKPVSEGGAPPAGPQPLTLQQRLAAFRSCRKTTGGGKAGGSAAANRSPADLMYLGGGLHFADGDGLDLYERMKGDIASHASGAMTRGLPGDVVVFEPAATSSRPHGGGGSSEQWHREDAEDVRVAVRGGVADGTLASRSQKRRQGVVVLKSLPSGPKAAAAASVGRRQLLDGSGKAAPKFCDRMADVLAPRAMKGAPS